MILGDLLDAPVLDPPAEPASATSSTSGFALDGPLDGLLAAPRLHGLLVSPRTGTSFLGYERNGVNAPGAAGALVRVAPPRHVPGALDGRASR